MSLIRLPKNCLLLSCLLDYAFHTKVDTGSIFPSIIRLH